MADFTSGLMLSEEDLTAVAGIEGLMAEYGNKGSVYTLSTTCKQFVTSLAAGKTKLKVGSLNMEGAAHSRFVDTVELLAKELLEFQRAEEELSRVTQRIEDGLSNDENAPLAGVDCNGNRDMSKNAREVHREYLQNEKMLVKLAEEQAAVDLAIRQKEIRKDQVLKSLESEELELSRPALLQKSLMSADPYAAVEQRDFEDQLTKIALAKRDAEELLAGLEGLVGISSLEIAPSGMRNGVQLVAEIGSFGTVLLLDGNRRLVDISLARGTYPHIADILSESITMPSPQDVRYAMFALGAVQRSGAVLTQHVSELRRHCIVRSNFFTTLTKYASVLVTLSNGVTASISVHPCYPEVPNGVSIDSLVGVGGWSMQELEDLRVTANSKCFCSLPDVVEHLVSVTADPN